MDEGRRRLSVRVLGNARSPEDLGNIVVTTTASGPVYLRNIAEIVPGYKRQISRLRYNGEEAVGISVVKQSDANTIEVADGVRAALTRIERSLPRDVRLVVTNDNSRFVRRSLEAIEKDLNLAILLTGVVLLLFLHTWRNTVIVMLAIPTSLIATFLAMYILGFSLNLMSMMALAMMIGILVDDSIVVLENIHRHLAMGEAPREAALKGRNEIGLAAIAITLADVIVYLPVAFMQGNIGRLFREYGLTVAAAALFSLFVSFTLTPMLASRWLKSSQEEPRGLWGRFTRSWERAFDLLRDGYGRVLSRSLAVRPLIVLVGVASVVIALAFIPLRLLGTEYVPAEDDGQFNVNIQMPAGTNVETTYAAVRELERQIRALPEVRGIYSSVGGGGGFFGGGGERSASMTVQLVDKHERQRSVFEIMNEVRRFSRSIPDISTRTSVQTALAGGGSFLQIRIFGPELATLRQIAGQISEVAQTVPGVGDVFDESSVGEPEVRFRLDRERMAALGVSANEAAAALRTMMQGTVASTLRREGQAELDITVIGRPADIEDLDRLASLPLLTRGNQIIRVGQIATVERAVGPSQIARADRERTLTISASAVGRPIGDVAQDLRSALRQVTLPTGYRVVVAGQAQNLDTALDAFLGLGPLTAFVGERIDAAWRFVASLFGVPAAPAQAGQPGGLPAGGTIGALWLSIILIYMLLVALYESWLHPLAIMFSLPVSLLGAFLALMISGNTLNLFSLIGIIMLMGIVTKNAILLVDFTNILRGRGYGRREALVEAGRTRLRPILMTTLTIVFAMLPLAMKVEAGGESRAPMAVVVIGGVVSSTVLTLILVPVVYTYLDDAAQLVQRLLGRPRRGIRLRPRFAGADGSAGAMALVATDGTGAERPERAPDRA
jgi:HAE1 family hydrophobic/amphiphilic exporter-1